MKPIKIGLRIWIAFTSIIAFLGGWALLSHANKPAPILASQTRSTSNSLLAPIPTLPAVPSLDQLASGTSSKNGSTIQSLPSMSFNNTQQFTPRLRTMGS